MRTIRHILEDNPLDIGRKLVLVPLRDGPNPPIATLFEETFYELRDRGVPDIWWLDRDKYPVCWSKQLQRGVYISRLIMKAGPGEFISPKDGDKLNLRTPNLLLSYGRSAKTREWDHFSSTNFKEALQRCYHQIEYSIDTNWLNGVNQIHELKKQLAAQNSALDRMSLLFRDMPYTTRSL